MNNNDSTTQDKVALNIHEVQLEISKFSWTGMILFQAGIMFWNPDQIFHLVGLFLGGISAFLILKNTKYISLVIRCKSIGSSPETLRYISNSFIYMVIVGLIPLAIACFSTIDSLLKGPNIFRNLIIMTGSFASAVILWSVMLLSLFAIALLFRRCSKRIKEAENKPKTEK